MLGYMLTREGNNERVSMLMYGVLDVAGQSSVARNSGAEGEGDEAHKGDEGAIGLYVPQAEVLGLRKLTYLDRMS